MDAVIITVWGKSGSGKSTLAVNLACTLAQTRCVGLVSSNLQYGHLQVFFGQTIRKDKGLLCALEEPSTTKSCFWKSGRMENLFLLSAPNDYSGLDCDNVSQGAVEQVLDRAKPYFEVIVVDGSEDLLNPISDVGISQSSGIVVVHRPSVASGLWYRSMGDFIHQLHLKNKLTHVVQESPWGLSSREYASALGVDTEAELPHISNAPQLENDGSPLLWERSKPCRQYGKQLDKLIQTLQERGVIT